MTDGRITEEEVEIVPVDLDEETEDDVEYLCLEALMALELDVFEIPDDGHPHEVRQFMRPEDNELMFKIARFAESWIENGGRSDNEINWRKVAEGAPIRGFTASP